MSGLPVDPALHATLRLALALLFAVAAWHKLRDPRGFREAVHGYGLLPEAFVASAARSMPVAELVAALALLVPGTSVGAHLALFLLLLYTLAVAVNLLRGRRAIDCGCGGPARRSLGGDLLLRNALLLGAALFCGLEPSQRPLVWVDALSVLAGACTLALLYAAAETAAANASPALGSRP